MGIFYKISKFIELCCTRVLQTIPIFMSVWMLTYMYERMDDLCFLAWNAVVMAALLWSIPRFRVYFTNVPAIERFAYLVAFHVLVGNELYVLSMRHDHAPFAQWVGPLLIGVSLLFYCKLWEEWHANVMQSTFVKRVLYNYFRVFIPGLIFFALASHH